ncbi:MAG: thioredoxin family protein [Polyangiaceae bacterium]|nr:thioredoxin family protein [Polyangiaceae bacterium]
MIVRYYLASLFRTVALVAIMAIAILAASAATAFGQETGGDAGVTEPCDPAGACPLDEIPPPAATGAPASAQSAELLFFWGVGCPHCEEAKPFLDALAKEEPRLRIERIEVRQNAEGRKRFIETMKRLGASAVGVPTFVVGDSYVVGYVKGETDSEIRALVRRALRPGAAIPEEARQKLDVPLLGSIDPVSVPLPALTLTMGLVDGVNPCAMWVLIVLLGILLHVKERRLMLLYAGTFVVMSGVVYFAFMTAWAVLFQLVGLSRIATMILGGALLVMGLINLKEIVFFKKGPSLVIPDRVKPGLFRRMRAIAGSASVPAAVGGILVLAFFVNLIELGCTIGLPAVYTRILSLRELSPGVHYAYLALYNVAYVVPLLGVAVTFIALHRKIAMTERAAKVLKGVSGALLTLFGLLFLAAPDLLLGT